MNKKMLKRLAALLIAGVMTFSNLNVYARDNLETEKVEQKVSEESVEQTTQFLIPVHYSSEIEVGKEATLGFNLCNVGTEAISSKDYDIKLAVTEGDEDVALTLEAYDEFELAPGDEWSGKTMSVKAVASAECTAKVIKYKVQIFNKADDAFVYESEELSIYPYTSSTECVLDGGNGFKISAPAIGNIPSTFSNFKLNVEEYTDESIFENLKECYDSFAELKGYTFKLSFIDDGEYDVKPEGNVTVTIPIPEGWDASRTEGFYVSEDGGMGSMSGKVSEDGKSILFTTDAFSRKLSNQYILMQKSIPVEVKDWKSVAANYILDARLVNWMTGTDWDSRFYEEIPSADDVAIIAMKNLSSKYTIDSPYHNEEKYRFEIPYDEFVKDAKDVFREVPDLKDVDNGFISYDAELDMMIVPEGGMGAASLVTEVVDTKKMGNSEYAICFKLSHKDITENPDMSDESQFRKCTLVVEDNGNGNWRYVSFTEGYLEDESEKEFIDVKKTDWFYDAVTYVSENKIMIGLTEDTFGPNEKLIRSQFATILYRLNGEADIEYNAKFPDVADGQGYTKGILWANSIGVVNGYRNGLFGPKDNITREQMTVMMYRYAKYKEYDISKTADISSFTDVDKVSGYAQDAFKWAVGSEIIRGKDGSMLEPQGKVTRAECATIMMRFMERYKK